jgi:hypothetical protein
VVFAPIAGAHLPARKDWRFAAASAEGAKPRRRYAHGYAGRERVDFLMRGDGDVSARA